MLEFRYNSSLFNKVSGVQVTYENQKVGGRGRIRTQVRKNTHTHVALHACSLSESPHAYLLSVAYGTPHVCPSEKFKKSVQPPMDVAKAFFLEVLHR